jgi:hypothetical protein
MILNLIPSAPQGLSTRKVQISLKTQIKKKRVRERERKKNFLNEGYSTINYFKVDVLLCTCFNYSQLILYDFTVQVDTSK